MKVRWLAAGLMVFALPGLAASDRLAMRVSPSVAFAPANLIVRAVVEADRSNRAIEIIAESPEFYRSSEIQLDGERGPRTTQFEFRSLPRGMYSVRAVLKGQGGSRLAMIERQVNVVDGSTVSR